jgi:hypothetical protein
MLARMLLHMPQTVHTDLDFPCPFCGLRAAASFEPPAVYHELPQCERFVRLEPTEYLAACHRARQVAGRPS